MKPRVVPKARVIVLPDNANIAKTFPHSKQFTHVDGKTYRAVPHGVEETRFLRRLGADVPSPMRLYYQWPREPFYAQEVTAGELLTMNRRAYVLNGLGTGKTLAALAAADYLMNEGKVKQTLVVAPLSTLHETWGDHLFRWFPHRRCVILHGSASKRRNLLSVPADFYVINHDGVEVLIDDLTERTSINLIVLDELATYRNGQPPYRNKSGELVFKNRRWAFASRLVRNRDYVWGLTGAPCPSEPTDAWAQVRLITPENVSWSRNNFRDKVMIDITKADMLSTSDYPIWVPKKDAMDKVYEVMQPSVRFTLDDCTDLPPIIYETLEVGMTAAQQRIYDDLVASIRKEITFIGPDGSTQIKMNVINKAVMLNKLLQVACGFPYDADGDTVDLKPNARMRTTHEAIMLSPGKTIVFVPYIGAIKGVVQYLQKQRVDVVPVYSATSFNDRSAIFSAFNNSDKYRAIVAQPGTMSHGLSLTAASTIIWFAPIHSLDTYIQANRRITRPGQTQTQVILHLQGSSIESRVYSRLKRKEKALDALLDLFQANTGDTYANAKALGRPQASGRTAAA